MSVSKDTNGTWTVQMYISEWTGKRKHIKKRGFRTKREAQQWEKREKGKKQIDHIKLKDFVPVYFQDKQNELKERTIQTKRHMIRKHILPYFGDREMGEIKPADIIRWQNSIIEKGYQETYLRMIQNQMNALYTHAVKIYYLSHNPCIPVKKMGNPDAMRIDFWTLEEYEIFLKQINPKSRYYMLFQTLYWTGMRIGELLALTKSDIDLNKCKISITKTYYRNGGKDMITAPKTSSSIRIIEIPTFLAEELEGYMKRIYDLRDEQRLFPIVQEAVQHKLKREIEKGDLHKIRVHDFRHSHVAYLIHQGIDPLIIKERLGHKDIKMTLNTYGHLYPTRQREVADMLDKKHNEKTRTLERKEKHDTE